MSVAIFATKSPSLLRSTSRGIPGIFIRRQMGSISIGTDMISSVVSLQKARPWYASAAEGSNKAADNAVTLKELFQGKKVAVFGVPAPFTGVCTNEHYPGYRNVADDLLKQVDEIVCYSVSDPYAHNGWATALKNDSTKIKFFADPDATFATAYGLDVNYDAVSLGKRAKRFSMIVVDGVVKTFRLVDNALTDAETLLEEAKELKENKA